MNRRVSRFILSAALACLFTVFGPYGMVTAFAGSAKISFSDPSASVGQEFNVSVKITAESGNLGASDVVLSYDPSYIEFVSGNNANGGAGSVRLIGTMDSDTTTVFSYNLKFKALQAGNTGISVGSYEVYDADTQAVDVTKVGSSTVKVSAPSNYSKEAALSSLKVSPGQLTPAFSPDVTSYTVNVSGDVSKIAVSANAKDGKAKVLVSGDSNLQVGANSVVCKVTAEDGQTTRSYKITVNKSESAEVPPELAAEAGGEAQAAVFSDLKADIGGVEMSIATTFDPAILPTGFAQSACVYNGNEIMCGAGYNLTLIYLQDAKGSGGFYIYNPATGALSPYVTIDVTARSIIVLPVDESVEVPSGFAETTIELKGEHEVRGWVWQSDEEENYCVIYGMNETGETGLYRYDIKEKTFQRYFEDPALKSQYDDAEVENLLNKYNSLCKDYNLRFIIIVVLIVLCLILFFLLINLLLRKRERHQEQREEAATPVKRRAAEEEGIRRRQTAPSYLNERRPKDARMASHDNRAGQIGYNNQTLIYHPDYRSQEVSQRGPSLVRKAYPDRPERYRTDPGMQETIRQREIEREERARRVRERLERERLADERRIRAARQKHDNRRTLENDDDDFEFMDLD